MKLLAVTLTVLVLATTISAQGGFLSNFFNRRPRPQQPRRPPPQQQQQPQQFQQQPQQQQFQPQPQQQQFQQQQPQQFQQQQPQRFQPQQQPQQQQFQQPQQQQQFNSRPVQQNPQVTLIRNNNNPNFQNNQAFRPNQANSRPQVTAVTNNNVAFRNVVTKNNNNNNDAAANTCPGLPAEDANDREGPQRCPDGLAPAFQYRGFNVILTWLEDSHPAWNEGCKTFTGIQADNYCKAQGGRAASLDTNEAAEQYMKQSAVYAQRYFWTGGRLNHRCGVLSWPSGKTEGWIKGQRFWSPTGGSKSKGPQPDNRHETEDGHPGEPEKCLGVLNNFYADGIKWHDVACHHKKPTICEVPINQG